MVRAVLDPGVLIAALISPQGAPAELLLAWRDGKFDLAVSPQLLAELERVLRRPKLQRRVAPEDAVRYVEMLGRAGTQFADPPLLVGVKLTPDPGDDYFVALARSARAEVLVSGDRHLTSLSHPRPPVLSPRKFLERLAAD